MALAVPPSGYDATLQRTPFWVNRSKIKRPSRGRSYQWIPREVRSLPKLRSYASRGLVGRASVEISRFPSGAGQQTWPSAHLL
jgi:hypothetical protein